MPARPKKLLDQVRDTLRRKHYAIRTEEAYLSWISRYIRFHHTRHPKEMGTPEIEAFLTHLAVDKKVAASTQNQALSAILFLYQHVLHQELQAPIDAARAKQPRRLPTVLTKAEAWRVIDAMAGAHQLLATLLYGSGLRLMEGVRLRVKDLDFAQHQIIVRDGNGGKDRLTVLPDSLAQPLQDQLKQVKSLHQQDLASGRGRSISPPRCIENIPTPTGNGSGSTFFRPKNSPWTRAPASSVDIIWMRAVCKKPSDARPG